MKILVSFAFEKNMLETSFCVSNYKIICKQFKIHSFLKQSLHRSSADSKQGTFTKPIRLTSAEVPFLCQLKILPNPVLKTNGLYLVRVAIKFSAATKIIQIILFQI